MQFRDVFKRTTNESPVTAKVMQKVLSGLAREGQFRIYDKAGALRLGGTIRHGTDIIAPHPQKLIFPPLRRTSGNR